ncbi:MAG: hypothetical protein ACFB11_22230 [Paracoccaceae bacterium]
MDQRSEKRQPLTTLRNCALKATIWENENNKGAVFHTVTFARTYEDKDGRLQDSHSFSRSELLRVAKLADRSDDLIEDRRRKLAVERTQDQAPSQEGRSDRFHNQSYGRNGPGLER